LANLRAKIALRTKYSRYLRLAESVRELRRGMKRYFR
jgi:hypothetical protein